MTQLQQTQEVIRVTTAGKEQHLAAEPWLVAQQQNGGWEKAAPGVKTRAVAAAWNSRGHGGWVLGEQRVTQLQQTQEVIRVTTAGKEQHLAAEPWLVAQQQNGGWEKAAPGVKTRAVAAGRRAGDVPCVPLQLLPSAPASEQPPALTWTAVLACLPCPAYPCNTHTVHSV